MADNKLQVGMMTLGMFGTNCYFVFDPAQTDSEGKNHCIFFDPADRGDYIYDRLCQNDLVVDLILLTHGHLDHIGGVDELRKLSKAPVYCFEKEYELCSDRYLNASDYFGLNVKTTPDGTYRDGEMITAAGISCKLIATPGHTAGGCCYYFEDSGLLICGDTLFAGSVGRTDLPTGSMSELLRSINDKMFTLPEETEVFPGHGEITTISREIEYNPYCRID